MLWISNLRKVISILDKMCYNNHNMDLKGGDGMIQVAIVEDDTSARARIRECLDYVAVETQVVFDIHEFSSGFSFIGQYVPGFDIVFMDIEMPGMNGMDTARALRKMDSNVVLIFVIYINIFPAAKLRMKSCSYLQQTRHCSIDIHCPL